MEIPSARADGRQYPQGRAGRGDGQDQALRGLHRGVPCRVPQAAGRERAAPGRGCLGRGQGEAKQAGLSYSAACGDAGGGREVRECQSRPGPAGPCHGKAAHAAPRQGDVPQAAPKGGRPDGCAMQSARPHGRRAGGGAGIRAMHAAAGLDSRRRAGSGMAGEEEKKEVYSGECIGMRSPSIPPDPGGTAPEQKMMIMARLCKTRSIVYDRLAQLWPPGFGLPAGRRPPLSWRAPAQRMQNGEDGGRRRTAPGRPRGGAGQF